MTTARRRTFKETMRMLGFRPYHNGGGFVCWESTITSEKQPNTDEFRVFLLLTDRESPGAPMRWDDPTPVTLGYYEESDHHGTLRHFTKDFANINEFVKWHETAEYLLPDNGDGPTANGWTEHNV